MTREAAEVVVVGAGPVGLAVAVGLRLHGHDVVVVDQQAEGANTSRACVIHPRTLEVLEELGVTERLVELGLQLQDFSIRADDRRLVPVGFADLPTAYPFVTMIPQPVTEQVLLERLQELGGSVLRPYAATGLTQTTDGAEVTLDSGDVIKAQYVVAADGMNSAIRELAGLRMPGNTLQISCSLVDVRVDGGLPVDEVALYFASAGLLVVAPCRAEAVRVLALAHRLTRLANVPRAIRPLRNAVLGLIGRVRKTQNDLAMQLAGL